MRLYDTHIHLLTAGWRIPLAERIAVARQSGIDCLLQPGVSALDWDSLVALSREYPGILAAPGLHPSCAAEWNAGVGERLRELCTLPQVVAIGEIGLDAQLAVDLNIQRKAFSAQIEIAIEAGLPVLIHCRKRVAELLQTLKQAGVGRVGGIIHGFSASVEIAEQAVELGLMIGVGPLLLRENARRLPAAVRRLPAEALVLETDAPDMATSPRVLRAVASKLAELRGWSLEETARITSANARRLLNPEGSN